MARYMQIVAGRAVNAIKVEDPAEFPDMTLVQSNSASIGDLWDGTTFSKDPASEAEKQAAEAERARKASIGDAVTGDAALGAILKATPAAIDNYIDANVNSLADARTFLKRLTKLVVSQLGDKP